MTLEAHVRRDRKVGAGSSRWPTVSFEGVPDHQVTCQLQSHVPREIASQTGPIWASGAHASSQVTWSKSHFGSSAASKGSSGATICRFPGD